MITADDLADFARSMVSDTAKEVRIRCGVGRAYYAAFHYCGLAADSWCGQLDPGEDKDKGEHSKLYLRLESHSNIQQIDNFLKAMAQEAKKLRDLRILADYNLTANVDMKTYTRSLHYMSEVKKQLEVIKTTLNGAGG